MQQTPWDFIPWRFVLIILVHIPEICKIVISGEYGNFICDASFALRGTGTTGSARKDCGPIELRRGCGRTRATAAAG